MKLSDNMIQHIKEEAEKIDYGEITIKLNGKNNIVDISANKIDRFHPPKNNKDISDEDIRNG